MVPVEDSNDGLISKKSAGRRTALAPAASARTLRAAGREIASSISISAIHWIGRLPTGRHVAARHGI